MTTDQPRADAIAAGPDAREAFIRRIVALTPGNFTDDFLFLLDRLDEARAAMTTPREDAIAALRAAVMQSEVYWKEGDQPRAYVNIRDHVRAALAAEADRAETRTIAARIERDARFRDALDALDLATLWLHRTMDLPHRDAQQAASWERKARSGRVALRAALAAETPTPERPAHGPEGNEGYCYCGKFIGHGGDWSSHTLAAEADRGTGDPLRKAAQEFLWEAQAYRTAHYNGTHMTADGTAAWAVREREFEKKAKALRAVLDARITEVTK